MRFAGFENYTLQLPTLDRRGLAPDFVPLPELLDPAVFPGDFSTGSLTLNRMIRRAPELSFELRRALIYGGDQLVP